MNLLFLNKFAKAGVDGFFDTAFPKNRVFPVMVSPCIVKKVIL